MENIEIVLKYKTGINKFGNLETVVKHGRMIEAKIYPPNASRKDYQIETFGMAFYGPTLESALEYVRKTFEDRSNAFGREYNFKVKIEKV